MQLCMLIFEADVIPRRGIQSGAQVQAGPHCRLAHSTESTQLRLQCIEQRSCITSVSWIWFTRGPAQVSGDVRHGCVPAWLV